jgi:predicted metal-binding membrane protein
MFREAEGTEPAGGGRTMPLRDRAVIIGAVLALAALCWVYLLHIGSVIPAEETGMSGMVMPGMAMPSAAMADPFAPAELGLRFAMWAVMMTGMMLPSALPMILTFAGISRRREASGQPFVPTMLFVGGYLLAWAGFSAAAAIAEAGLERAALMSPMAGLVGEAAGGCALLLAGLYQFTPLKYACLRHCRSPIGFILTRWREGPGGAVAMGLEHGAYCLGCCWALMALLFAGGVMNILWAAAIAAFVLIEKALPLGHHAGRAAGLVAILVGGYLLIAASGLNG